MQVTCGVPTKDRYDSLVLTLAALAFQTYKDFHIIIVDDSDQPKDIREIPTYLAVFELLRSQQITWQVVYGRKMGQHYSHQMVQDISRAKWIWRVDDDEVPEQTTLEQLVSYTNTCPELGAVAGLVLPSIPTTVPANANNIISDVNLPNLQWFKPSKNGVHSVEHLHSTFLYRRGIARYELALSPAAHREETLFTHEIFRAGYKLLIDPSIVTWHFRSNHGGIRSYQDVRFWEEDDKLFQDKLQEWGVNTVPCKSVVLDCGRGDQVIVKSLIPRLKEKYGRLVMAVCNNDIFEGEDVELISIAEAKLRFGNLDRFNIYRWCIDHNHDREIVHAFEEMYGI